MRGVTLIAFHKVVQKFGYRVDSGNQQIIPGARNGGERSFSLFPNWT
jgi:hypothetical protein